MAKRSQAKAHASLQVQRKQKKAKKLLKRSNKELLKRLPDLEKVVSLQTKALQHLNSATSLIKNSSTNGQQHHNKNDFEHSSKPSLNYTLRKVSQREVKKYGAHACVFTGKVTNINNSKNLLKDCMQS